MKFHLYIAKIFEVIYLPTSNLQSTTKDKIGVAKKTRKFAAVKQMIGSQDPHLY